jgi:single-strand DNA-binding protein
MTDTQWHHVIAWGKTAELIELYLGKGKEVALEGKLVTRFWDDQEGQRRYATEVHCHTLLML